MRLRLLFELVALALATLTLTEGCELDEFECVKNGSLTEENICLSKYRQCDGSIDCKDGWDENNCTVEESCSVKELSCKQDSDSRCYNATTNVCTKAIYGSDPKCDDLEDVQHCRCDSNQQASKPYRCPTDGMCYDNDANWCTSCPGSLSCNTNVTADACGHDPNYFSCTAKNAQNQGVQTCFPLAALCDAHKHCLDTTDATGDASPCRPATVTLDTPDPVDYYMGHNLSIVYTVTGFPKPTYTFYHYGKPMTMPMSFNVSTVTVEYVDDGSNEDGDPQYKLTVLFTNLTIFNYGDYELVVSNVASTTVNNDENLSYYHRIVADKVTLDFKDGLPTATMLGDDMMPLTEDVSTVAKTSGPFSLSCKATGYPEPTISFTLDGGEVDPYHDWRFNLTKTQPFNATISHEKIDTLVFLDDYFTKGNYSCTSYSELEQEGVSSDHLVEVFVLTSPVITSMTGTEGVIYTKVGEEIALECVATGHPAPMLRLYAANEVIDGLVIVYDEDGETSTINHTVTNDVETLYKCEAEVQIDVTIDSIEAEVIATPVVQPTITVQDSNEFMEGEVISIPVHVTTGIDMENGQHAVTVSILYSAGGALDETYWTIEGQYNSETLTKEMNLTSSALNATVGNIGDYQVTVDNSVYEPVTMTFSVNVKVPLQFEEELEPQVQLQVNQTEFKFRASVLGNPAPSKAEWFRNDLILDRTYWDACEVLEDATDNYVTTYECYIAKAMKNMTALYKIQVTQPGIDGAEDIVLESLSNLTVSENPCEPNNPCLNRAVCVNLGENMAYRCNCTNGFSGDNCELNNWCSDTLNQCQNGGECTALPPVNTTAPPDYHNYTCSCPFGFENWNCDYQVDFCERTGTDKCGVGDENGDRGLCVHTREEPLGYDCYCKHSYGGLHCDLMQYCTPNPCANEGVCNVAGEGEGEEESNRNQWCTCKEGQGWTGDTCEDMEPGHCWHDDCTNAADCAEDGGACLCHYPYYMEHCEEELHTVNTLHVAAYGYLVASAGAALEEAGKQELVLPVQLTGDTGTLLVMSDETSGDNVTLTLAAGTLEVTVETSEKNDDGASIPDTSHFSLENVPIGEPITLTLSFEYRMLGVVVETYHTGDIISTGFDLVYECNEFTNLRLSDQVGGFNTGEASGVEMLLWSDVKMGEYSLDPIRHYSSGRSVQPVEPCTINLCKNGGTCVNDTIEYCDCSGTGYAGDHCDQIETCDVECLNGGKCELGFCNCQLGYHGVLCEEAQGVSGDLRVAGDTSSLGYETADAITSVKVEWMDLMSDISVTTRTDILTIGGMTNYIKIVAVSTELYLVVIRGSKTAVHPGVGQIRTSSEHKSSLELSIVDGGIQIRLYDPDTENQSGSDPNTTLVTFTSTEHLPCSDGLPDYQTVELQGVEGVSADVRVSINNVLATPTSGMNTYQGADDVCVGACGDGNCTQSGNMIKCHNCPEATNPVTCGAAVCDPVTCMGTCTQIGECVCDFNHQGPNCDSDLVITEETYPKTISSQFSWLQYQADSVQDVYVDVSFYVWLEGVSQTGQLMFAGTEEQHLSMTLDGTTLTVAARCSSTVKTTVSLEGVEYGKWIKVGVDWYQTGITLTADTESTMIQFGICWFDFDGTFYLGGLPGATAQSVMATFSDVAFMLPPQTAPVDGAAVETSEIHVCDGPVGPCSRRGTAACINGTGTSFTCECNSGYEGTLCGDTIQYDPCDDVICPEPGICREGECVCAYPYLQNDTCMTMITEMLGFCFIDQGYLTMNTSGAPNAFDLMFRFNIADDLEVGEYELIRVDFDDDSGDLKINKTADSVSAVSSRLGFQLPLKEGINTVRLQMTGLGVYFDINEAEWSNNEAPVLSVSSIRFGSYTGVGYPGCIFDGTVNGQALDTVSEGFGVKVCNDFVMEDAETDIFGVAADWAIVGIL